MSTTTSFAPRGSVNLADVKYSISRTRSNFTRLRENFRRVREDEPSPDFITLASLICEIYRTHGENLAPVCQIQASQETQWNKGHTSTISHTKIPGFRISKVAGEQSSIERQNLIVKRPRQSILEEKSYALISFITELRIRTHPPLRDHPSIARFRGIGWDFEDEEATIPRPLLLEELAPQGALDNFWEKWSFIRLNFKQKLDMCQDVAEGLLALHQCGIVHGDIKPGNILVFPRPSSRDEFMVKLTDFGHSVFEHNRLNTLPAFTPQWCAPEASTAVNMTFKEMAATDCYSFGLVMLSIMIGRSFHVGCENIESHKQNYLMLRKAMELIEREDRENTESDLDVNVIESLLDQTIQQDARKRNLKHCLAMIRRYNEINNYTRNDHYGHHTSQAKPLDHMDTSQMVIIGYQTLLQTSYQLKQHIVSALLVIANNRKDPRRMACAWELAICYFSGFGVPVSYPDCSEWLSRASKGGVAAAHKFSTALLAAMEIHNPQLQKPQGATVFSVPPSTSPIREQSVLDVSHQAITDKTRTRDTHIVDDHMGYQETRSQDPYDTSSILNLPEEISSTIQTGSLTDLENILTREPELLNRQDKNGDTMLLLSAKAQRRDMLDLLLSQPKIDASICDNSQRTVLHELATFDGPTVRRMVPELLANNANIYQETLPKASHDMDITISLGIRCDSLLNSILAGNIDLLSCLLEASHSPNAKTPCQICESGSRFRITLVISLSILRADAVELLVEHMKGRHVSHDIDLSHVKVWAGQDLLPLHEVPFNSVIISAVDLPDSLFRAISYGAEYNEFLDRTIRFLLTVAKHENGNSLAYAMLNQAARKNNVDAVNSIFRQCKSKMLPTRWWVKSPDTFLPLTESVRLGHREVYETFLKEDPTIFSEYINVQCSADCPPPMKPPSSKAMSFLSKLKLDSAPRTMKKHVHRTNPTFRALKAFVMSPHMDTFFLESVLDKSSKHLVTSEITADLFQISVLKSSFTIANVIVTRYPELLSLPPQSNIYQSGGFYRGGVIDDPPLVARRAGAILGILCCGSYEQCQFLLKKVLPKRTNRSKTSGIRASKQATHSEDDGVPQWTKCPLSRKEFSELVSGNIRFSADRQSLWNVIEEQVRLGHSTSMLHLRVAIRQGNTDALEQMLSRGWNSNGDLWSYFSPLLLLVQKLSNLEHFLRHDDYDFKMLIAALYPGLPQDEWIGSATHPTVYKEYQRQLKIFTTKEWTTRMEMCRKTLVEHGARIPSIVTYFTKFGQRVLVWSFIASFLMYFIVLPPCLVYLTTSVWDGMSIGQKFGFVYLWAALAFSTPFGFIIFEWDNIAFRTEKLGVSLISALFLLVNNFLLPVFIIRLNWKPFRSCETPFTDGSMSPVCTNYSFLLPLPMTVLEWWVLVSIGLLLSK